MEIKLTDKFGLEFVQNILGFKGKVEVVSSSSANPTVRAYIEIGDVKRWVHIGTLKEVAKKIKYSNKNTIKTIIAEDFVRSVTGWGLIKSEKFVDKLKCR